jgi:uroporphyrinogen-III decarboxylase
LCGPFCFWARGAATRADPRAPTRDPGYAKALFEFAEDKAILPFLKAQRAAGVKQSFGPDAWACFPNITPDIFEEWVVPSAKRLKEKAKKFGMTAQPCQAAMDYCEEDPAKFDKQILFHCLDEAAKLLMLPVCTVAMGRTQDLDPHWLQEYALSRGKGGRKIPIMASLNGRFVRDSSPQQIVDKVRQWVDVMGRDGRLVLFIGNVHTDTPQVNVHTAVKATHTLGRYPIAADLDSIKVDPPAYPDFDEWLKGQPEEDIIRRARE